jgi:hypothetical protein
VIYRVCEALTILHQNQSQHSSWCGVHDHWLNDGEFNRPQRACIICKGPALVTLLFTNTGWMHLFQC